MFNVHLGKYWHVCRDWVNANLSITRPLSTLELRHWQTADVSLCFLPIFLHLSGALRSHGFTESVVRGLRSGFLGPEDYRRLGSCDTLEDMRSALEETDYGTFLQETRSKKREVEERSKPTNSQLLHLDPFKI